MDYHGWWLPKQGHTHAEYEDAHAVNVAQWRAAIADGATETSFAKQWAELLVAGFVDSPLNPYALQRWAGPLQQRWRTTVGERPRPWYAEIKLEQGAFAAFLGLVLEHGDGTVAKRWWAVALGDSCLFQVRGDRLLRSFPPLRACDFSHTPLLLGARAELGKLEAKVTRMQGDWLAGDLLWLLTDALAHWFVAEVEAARQPWTALAALASQDAFAAWIHGLRQQRLLHNDDVTAVCLRL